jgi:hypothetical protein
MRCRKIRQRAEDSGASPLSPLIRLNLSAPMEVAKTTGLVVIDKKNSWCGTGRALTSPRQKQRIAQHRREEGSKGSRLEPSPSRLIAQSPIAPSRPIAQNRPAGTIAHRPESPRAWSFWPLRPMSSLPFLPPLIHSQPRNHLPVQPSGARASRAARTPSSCRTCSPTSDARREYAGPSSRRRNSAAARAAV